LTLQFTKHAKAKLRIRQIDVGVLEEVLSRPEQRFYDVLRNSNVVAGRVSLNGEAVVLVIVFTKKNGDYRIITIYPSKRFEEEAKRKIKSGRWVTIKGEAYEGQLRPRE